jgi:hypothetical protein
MAVTLLCAALLLGAPINDRRGGGGQASDEDLHLDDDTDLSMGGSSGSPDYWCEHDTAATPDELACWTTDGDGGGADAKWISVPDGTDDPVFSGAVSLGEGTRLSSAVDGHLTIADSTGTQTFALQTNADGKLHLSGVLYTDLGIVVADNRTLTIGDGAAGTCYHSTDQTPDTLVCSPGPESNILLIFEYYSGGVDFAHSLKTDPTIIMHATGNIDKTTYNEIDWHRLALGGGGGGYGCLNQTFAYDDLVDGGGASGTIDLEEGIPDGAVVQQTVLHSLTGFTGDTSAVITVGDGTDVDRYNTGTPSVFTTNVSGIAMGAPSGTVWHDDAATVTVTVTSNGDYTSVSAGQATILICYWTP